MTARALPAATSAPVDAAAEGDVNRSPLRQRFETEHLHDATRLLLDADALHFLHQSLSTPCVNALVAAEGIWLEDCEGRRIMDFHGNNVHQVGYRHPRVIAAVKAQLDTLPFSPRRFTNPAAVDLAGRLASLAPDPLAKVLFAPGGTLAIGMALKLARLATGRHKTLSLWDSFHGASLDAISIGGEAVFRKGIGPVAARHRARAALRSLRLQLRLRRELQPALCGLSGIRAGQGRGHRRGHRGDGALHRRADSSARLLPQAARRVRPARCAADPRRGADLPRPHRTHVRVRALRHRSGHGGFGQRSWRRGLSDGGARRPQGPRHRARTARSATTPTRRAPWAVRPRWRRST